MLWDDDIAASREDEAQLRRDMRYHPRTSGKSLREMARMCATQGSLHVTRRLDECYAWLQANRDQLPAEVEDDTGARPSSQRLEVSGTDYEDVANDAAECDLETGLYDVGQAWRGCYMSLVDTLKSKQVSRRLLHRHGMTHEVYFLAMRMRASRFRKYNKERKRWLRWGCYYSDQNWYGDLRWARAYENTTAILERVERTPMNVLDVPDNISDLMELDGDVLRWKVARGRAAVGSVVPESEQIRIQGRRYTRSRIVQYLSTGWLSDYRKVTGTKLLREDSNWDVQVKLGGKTRTIMVCHTEEEADQALWAVRWTVDNFQ